MRRLSTSSDSELNTFVVGGERGNRFDADEIVQVGTVDKFCHERNIVSLDVLKMDVQGWECEVLRGAHRMMSESKIRFVVSEVGFIKTDIDITQFSAFHSVMENYGFCFCGLYNNFRFGPSKEYIGFANALYMRRT